jgi:hypothetical protein
VLALLLIMQFVIAVYKNRFADFLPGGSPNRDWPAYAVAVPVAVAVVCVAEMWLLRWDPFRWHWRPSRLAAHIRKETAEKWVAYRDQAVGRARRLSLSVTFDVGPRGELLGPAGDSAALLDVAAVMARPLKCHHCSFGSKTTMRRSGRGDRPGARDGVDRGRRGRVLRYGAFLVLRSHRIGKAPSGLS